MCLLKLLAGAPVDKIVIVGDGFEEEDAIKCSRPNIDIRELKGFHEEADTRMVLHCVQSDAEFLCRLVSRHGCFLTSSFTAGQNELQAVVDESLDTKEAQVSANPHDS